MVTAERFGAWSWLARLADRIGLELRIFTRDGDTFSAAPAPDPKESPNADLCERLRVGRLP